MFIIGKRLNPIGFIAITTDLHPGISVRFLRWFAILRPTKHELFSQREGLTKTYRFAGLSFSVRRVKAPW